MDNVNMKEAIILAGGFGTRLQSVIQDLPKPMAPINGKPFLSYLLDYLIAYQYNHVILSTGYLHDKIEDYFGNQYKSVPISYARETVPLGTGGGIQFALSNCVTQNVLILNGDTLFKVDLARFEQFHKIHNSKLSIVLREVDNVSRYGSVIYDDNSRIINFMEKNINRGKGFINGGIYLIDKELFSSFSLPEKFSFEKDLMERYYQSEQFFAMVSNGYFIDIGIPDDYYKAQKEL